MAQFDKSKANPDLIGNFVLIRNKTKTEAKHPDLVHPDSKDENGNPKLNKAGKPFKQNFTVNGIWCEASGYIQEDKSIKIRILKTSVYEFIKSYMKKKPVAPTYQEILEATGFKSKNSIHRILKDLEEKKWIARLPGKSRSIRVL